MTEARARFLESMEKEMRASEDVVENEMDIDFSITESGRTIAQIVSGKHAALDDDMSFSTGDSNRERITNSDREDLANTLSDANDHHGKNYRYLSTDYNTTARSIPVPKDPQQNTQYQPQSQASSQGSSGSAFLSSVLNPTASTFGSNQLSHTPPAASSYEASHFGKRARSGSVSGRLRSASEYLEERGLLDRTTKGILKDLIIIGDEEIQQALDRYESGDPSVLEDMIKSGALQDRLPKDIDILGDLDLDFLNFNDDAVVGAEDIEALAHADHAEYVIPPPASKSLGTHHEFDNPSMVSPQYDDGIGDLDFAGDFVSDQTEYMPMHPQTFGSSKHPSAATSPQEYRGISEYEQRMRSNSLFSALLNEPKELPTTAGTNYNEGSNMHFGDWMDRSLDSTSKTQGIKIATRRASAPTQRSGIAESLEADSKKKEKKVKKPKKEKKDQPPKKDAAEKEEPELKEEHISGSGRPRTLSDPNLQTSIDSCGLMNVERPDGWVGAYSPESRKVRIERFLDKRNHRVWTKTVKYDVRKNFADSRLRVKGRFVKKEDELLMRELMSLT